MKNLTTESENSKVLQTNNRFQHMMESKECQNLNRDKGRAESEKKELLFVTCSKIIIIFSSQLSNKIVITKSVKEIGQHSACVVIKVMKDRSAEPQFQTNEICPKLCE